MEVVDYNVFRKKMRMTYIYYILGRANGRRRESVRQQR
jgi:hypothetical protein